MQYFWYIFLAANLAVTIWFWSLGLGVGWMIALGRLAGLLAMLMLLLQLVTMGRLPWLERLYGHDRLNKFHRIVGYSVGFFILAHPVLIVIGLHLNVFDLLRSSDEYLKAAIAFCIIIFVVVFTVLFRKKVKYETWHFTHMLVYVAIILVFGHQVLAIQKPFFYYWYAIVFTVGGLFILFRWLRPLYRAWYYQFRIERVVRENHDVHSVYITGCNLDRFTFEPGQFANLVFLQRGMWFSHPFSFSQSSRIRFTMKNCGDFTARIGELKPGTRVIIDGPMGVFVKRRARTNKFLFIAGGIGITPIRALVESLNNSDSILLYAARSEEDLVFKKDFDAILAHRHYFTTERITQKTIADLVPDLRDRDTYLCGPPPMMDAMIAILRALGVPKAQIHFEKFSY